MCDIYIYIWRIRCVYICMCMDMYVCMYAYIYMRAIVKRICVIYIYIYDIYDIYELYVWIYVCIWTSIICKIQFPRIRYICASLRRPLLRPRPHFRYHLRFEHSARRQETASTTANYNGEPPGYSPRVTRVTRILGRLCYRISPLAEKSNDIEYFSTDVP